MTVTIKPTDDQISHWIENYVSDIDLFFIEEEDLSTFSEFLSSVLIVSRQEFFNHSSYQQIHLKNSYMYWNISSRASYVLVAHPNWITNLPEQKKREILHLQYEMGRGLMFPFNLFSSTNLIPLEYIVEGEEERFVVIQHSMWNELPHEMKQEAMIEYAKLWDSWTCLDVPKTGPIHIRKYANTFSTEQGSNCLSATLFAVTKQEWIIGEWVHQDTFKNGLKSANYSLINDDEFEPGDVIVWVNTEDVIQHASYHISHHFFFNKNGQTVFNPWRIVHFDELTEHWNQFRTKVYRKKGISPQIKSKQAYLLVTMLPRKILFHGCVSK